ncbi:hypothetical protein [Qipengyuania marisflavi]|uniref:Sodium:proline symporter n=1 Tax=Qipengyuania marisflavi TaxID=2486356 RepID=A0A5S3PER1_9SPHN|nr:hypothetical protein [Qipengyuania marisflavi]TMM50070.1 hypothetical protein FEV51_02415 [Qipengyuania marisflavi]
MTIRNGIIAGLVAGLVFLLVEMMLVPTVGGGALWGPPRMMAAIGMGPDVLPPPATFDAAIVMVGMIIHFVLSAVLGALFALAMRSLDLSRNMVMLVGMLFGLAIYFVNFYGFTAMFPWFAMARGAITAFAHLVFGGVLGWCLVRNKSAGVST